MGRLLQPITYPDLATNIAFAMNVDGEIITGECSNLEGDYWANIIQTNAYFGWMGIRSNACGYVYMSADIQWEGTEEEIGKSCSWDTGKKPCDCVPQSCNTIDGEYTLHLRNGYGGMGCANTVTVALSTGGLMGVADVVDAGLGRRGGGCLGCRGL